MKKFFTLLTFIAIIHQQRAISQTWQSLSSGATNNLNAIYFASANNGWVAGAGNIIRATTDGGNTWTAQTSGLSSSVVWNGIQFTSATNGCVVGPASILCITTNGGANWTQVNSGTSYTLNSVHFPSSTNGFAVGNGGVIIATTNGGTSWSMKVPGASANTNLKSVHFTSTTTGWISGENGLIRKSTDGGTTWTNQTSGTTQTLNDIYFASATQGWAVGGNGTILVTSNGGSSWTAQTSGTTNILRSIYFISTTQGWTIGDNGIILATSNGGATWTVQPPPQFFNAPLYSVYMNSSTLGFAAGVAGSVIKYCSAPAQPGIISGNTTVCSGSSQTYSIAAVPGATSYTWTLPSGWSGTSTTNSITAIPATGVGTIYVTANNGNCISPNRTLNVTTNASPAQPGTISGNANPCVGSSQTYSVSAVGGASSYTWTLPSGWTGTSTTNSITASVGSTGGTISVRANNSSGCSSAIRTLTVTTNTAPSTPGTITGNATVCSGTAQTYSVTAVAGATSYSWTMPSGWTGSSTTNSINTTSGTTSGNISITATNTCGTSIAATKAITVNTIPATPGTISGSATICSNSVNIYSITAVAGATSYTWTLPSGWTGTSTTNSISTTASSTSGNISVTANNSCGASNLKTLAITVNTVPSTPSSIIGQASVCAGTTNLQYNIASVPGATYYTWTLPSGWTGNSTTNIISLVTSGSSSGNIVVTANNICGTSSPSNLAVTVDTVPAAPDSISGSTSVCSGISQTYNIIAIPGATNYNWTLPSGWAGSSNSNSITTTTGLSGGNITVTATNSCGTSSPTILAISISGSGNVPAAPTSVTGNDTVCAGTTQIYIADSVSGASNYSWTLPVGWTGTSTTNNINVVVGSTGGSISVTANNSCGSSAASNISINVNPMPNNTVTINNNIITAIQTGANYQWLNCTNNYSTILGETNQSFTATNNGDYAVEISLNGCIDTSSCNNIANVSINELNSISEYIIYPNPNNGSFKVEFLNKAETYKLAIVNTLGQTLVAFRTENEININLNIEDGVYFVKIIPEGKNKVDIIKVIKQ